MGQYFGFEKITKLIKTSSTTVALPLGSVLRMGGQGTNLLNSLTLLTSVSGFGGIDTGAVAASSFYYVYVVKSGGNPGLVASLSATSPTGFTAYRKVGAFYTDASSNIFKAYYFNEINRSVMTVKGDAGGITFTQSDTFIATFTRPGTGNFAYTFLAGIFSIPPSVTVSAEDLTSGVEGSAADAVTASGFTAGIRANSTNTNKDHACVVAKQGVDAIQPDWSLA